MSVGTRQELIDWLIVSLTVAVQHTRPRAALTPKLTVSPQSSAHVGWIISRIGIAMRLRDVDLMQSGTDELEQHERLTQPWEKCQLAFFKATLSFLRRKRENFHKGIEIAQEGLKFAETAGDLRAKLSLMQSLGVLYSGLGEHEKAIEAYQAIMDDSKVLDNLHSVGNTYGNIGHALLYMGETDKGMEMTHEAVHVLQQLGDVVGARFFIMNLGVITFYLGRFETTLNHLEPILELLKQMGRPTEYSSCLSCCASSRIHQELQIGHDELPTGIVSDPASRKNLDDWAHKILESSVRELDTRFVNAATLAKYYIAIGERDAARTHAKEALQLKDSLGGRVPVYKNVIDAYVKVANEVLAVQA